MTPAQIPFERLSRAELIVGAIYEGGTRGTSGDDPMSKLLPCGNRGGFRIRGSRKTHSYSLALLYTTGADPDWPDFYDDETGLLTYFGDNKEPGSELHATRPGGNELLRFSFEVLHTPGGDRSLIPPFFVFRKAASDAGRDVEFIGLAVPGGADVDPTEDLVAVWRSKEGSRFQNYKSTFTILDVPVVPRVWVDEINAGEPLGGNCPLPFRTWVERSAYLPLEAPRTLHFRSPEQQLPTGDGDVEIVRAIHEFFEGNNTGFEACAIELWKMLANEAVSVLATRPTRDGGRDAVGTYSMGPPGDRIHLDFSLEAKCYALDNGCGVKETSRLISRLRHRQFGVFVTTSYVTRDPYREIREDGHPVVVIAARDIVEILKMHGIATEGAVREWLAAHFEGAGTT